MKRILLLAAAASLALAGCKRGDAASILVETAGVERRDIIVDAQATGVIEPIFIVEVKSRSSGQIIEMPVEVGSEVRPGELLVQLDTRDVKNQYDQAAADLAAARARLEVAQAQRDRNKNLYDAQIITRQEFETSSLEYENARAQIIRTETSLDLAQQRLDEARVVAPVAGTVIEKPTSIGQVITSATQSASGGTTILKMADLNRVRVRALVNESDIGQIRAGQVTRVTVDAYPDRPFVGTVEQVEPQAVVQQSVTMFPVLISLSNEEGLLKPGMNGEVSVEIDRRENVLTVSNDAVRTLREVPTAAAALGLDPDSVQAQLRAQMAGARGPGGPGAGPGAAPRAGGDTGAAVRVGGGDVALDAADAQRPQGGQGPQLPAVTAAQCSAVDSAFARQPGARRQLDSLRAGMRSGTVDMQAMRAATQRIYAGIGVDARTAMACARQQGGAAPGGAPQGAAPAGADARAAQGGAPQGGAPQGAAAGAPRGGMGGGMGGMGGGRGRGGRTGLVFVAKNGTYEPRMVRLGASDFDYTEVLSGVEEGESVALLAAAALQAQRDERNEQIRSRMGGPLGAPGGGGPPAGGARPGGR